MSLFQGVISEGFHCIVCQASKRPFVFFEVGYHALTASSNFPAFSNLTNLTLYRIFHFSPSTFQLSHSLHLKGCAWTNNVFPLGGEPTGPGEESMAAIVSPAQGQAPPPNPILVLFVYHMGRKEARFPSPGRLRSGVSRHLWSRR